MTAHEIAVIAGPANISRRPWRAVVGALLVAVAGLSAAGMYLQRGLNEPIALPAVLAIDVTAALFDVTPTKVRKTVAWQKVFVTVPRWDFLRDRTIWQQMQFEDWDSLPDDAREAGLERLLDRYGGLALDRHAWRTMTAEDWDDVPQPVRAMAFAGMVEYWVGHYDVGASWGLDRGRTVRTVKAIAMSESWFEHRAFNRNQDGSLDIGIGGASAFARETIRDWYAEGLVDFTMSDEDYYNPWLAARWLAFWFKEMLQEAHGDPVVAIRAYNRGIASALKGAGDDYLEAVRRRRRQYFEGPSRSPTWRALSVYRRQQIMRLPVTTPHVSPKPLSRVDFHLASPVERNQGPPPRTR
jgi:transglycosylase-like protein with SLT domain